MLGGGGGRVWSWVEKGGGGGVLLKGNKMLWKVCGLCFLCDIVMLYQ